MKPFIISKSAWHYRIAMTYGAGYWQDDHDFCSYLRSFVMGMIGIILVIIVSSGFLSLYVDLGAWAIVNFFITPVVISEFAITAITFTVIGTFTAILLLISNWVEKRRQRIRSLDNVEKQPTFINRAWRALHDKYCVPIEFTIRKE